MTSRTRNLKRKRAEEKKAAESLEIEEIPMKKPTKKKNRRDAEGSSAKRPAGEDSSSAKRPEQQEETKPSGHPFTDGEVEWKLVRPWLLGQTKKVIPGGYKGLCGEVNDIMKQLSHSQSDKVRHSSMGEFTRLDNKATRNGNMLGYVLSHQVIPEPTIDSTALYFKIGHRVIRFSREEYALVSGLKFGPASFNPYTTHDIPPNSTFSRLFGENPNIRLCDVKTACLAKNFKVSGETVNASPDDIVKLCKLMLCLGFVLGVDGSKKKIPIWMWVLLEKEEEWESFPWGSISYQVLLETVNGITKKPKKEGTLNITFKGNTVAFSAWIFEAIPAFGEVIGLKNDEHQIPRFMQYSYAKDRGWPSEKQIKKRVVRMLKAHSDEKVESFWKSLELDPAPNPLCFKYDPTDSMKKKGKIEEEGDEENTEMTEAIRTSSTALINAAADAAVTKSQAAMKSLLEEFHKTSLKGMLADYHKTLVEDVAEKVASVLLERAETDNAYSGGGNVNPTLDTVDHMADTQNTMPSTPLEAAISDKVVMSTPETTKVVAVEESTKIPTSVLASPGNSLFSLGVNFNSSQVEEFLPVSEKLTILAKAAVSESTKGATHPATAGAVSQAAPSAGAMAATTPPPATPTTPTTTEATPIDRGEGINDYDGGFSDSQIDRVFDSLPFLTTIGNLNDVQREQPTVWPVRLIFPARAVRSPFLREDKRPKPDEFKLFMQRGKTTVM